MFGAGAVPARSFVVEESKSRSHHQQTTRTSGCMATDEREAFATRADTDLRAISENFKILVKSLHVGQVNGEVQDKEADAAPAVSIAEQNFNDAFRSNKLAALQSQVAAQNLVRAAHSLSGVISDLQLAFTQNDYPTHFQNWQEMTENCLGAANQQYVKAIDRIIEQNAAAPSSE